MTNLFKECVENFVTTLLPLRDQPYRSRPEFNDKAEPEDLLRAKESIIAYLSSLSFFNEDLQTAKISVASGGWAAIPWFAIMNNDITTSTTAGTYIVGLFHNNLDSLFIGIGTGVTRYEPSRVRHLLTSHSDSVRDCIESSNNLFKFRDLIWDKDFELGASGKNPDGYINGTVVTKQFDVRNMPNDAEINDYFGSLNNCITSCSQLIIQNRDELDNARGQSEGASTNVQQTSIEGSSGLFWDKKLEQDFKLLIGRKKNVILQGPPGVGKTYWVNRYISDLKKSSAIPPAVYKVQFHQAYSYEDFVMGFRPTIDGGFTLEEGIFKKAVDDAIGNELQEHVVVIDEINRGNISKIFGELLSLIEADKRSEEWKTSLPYNKEPFYIPPNLTIIGMMNSADKSISIVDYALRRRFGFIEIPPAITNPEFLQFLKEGGLSNKLSKHIVKTVSELNNTISKDQQLGDDFAIGHSFFMSYEEETDEKTWFNTVLEYEIKPLLQEYWFEDKPKANDELRKLSY